MKVIYKEIPLRVEYKLTKFGKDPLPVLNCMNGWGSKTIKMIINVRKVIVGTSVETATKTREITTMHSNGTVEPPFQCKLKVRLRSIIEVLR